MLKDLSYYSTRNHDPKTPFEIQLSKTIEANRAVIDAAVYRILSPMGYSRDQSDHLVIANLDKSFYSYIEKRFPLEFIDFQDFLAHITTYIQSVAQKNNSHQYIYGQQIYQQTNNPRGKRNFPYPEVL